ncbi:hypothetical protein NQ317_008348 [Molorchus minor]|uniref:Uncharacterized protein n=1 Tax=Molorchus minor TaxID=1323400 RepID=A0ABQ9K4H3_9CUCU|nr:hypothetical protein NQ317_008348 [Molorchus minor]
MMQTGAPLMFGNTANRINGDVSPSKMAIARPLPEKPTLLRIEEKDHPVEKTKKKAITVCENPKATPPVIVNSKSCDTNLQDPVDSKSKPCTLKLRAQSTYDLLLGLDSADLRFMDESSIAAANKLQTEVTISSDKPITSVISDAGIERSHRAEHTLRRAVGHEPDRFDGQSQEGVCQVDRKETEG